MKEAHLFFQDLSRITIKTDFQNVMWSNNKMTLLNKVHNQKRAKRIFETLKTMHGSEIVINL